MRSLAVYNNDVLAGILTEEAPGRGYVFRYAESYLSSGGHPVSYTLPLRKEPFESEHLFPFFSNMLPEGANRRMICRAKRIDEEDLFGVLIAMAGKDTIGSVNVREIDR
jgi:serine/threonine-protein kinase HipA